MLEDLYEKNSYEVVITFCQVPKYLPSQGTSPPFAQYQLILLGEGGKCVSTTCPE